MFPHDPSQFNLSKLYSAYVDEPLIPLSFSPVQEGSEKFPEILEILRVDQSFEAATVPGSKDQDGVFSDDLLTTLEEQSKTLVKATEQERLRASNSEARVSVPILDFSIPDPECQEISSDSIAQRSLIRHICEVSRFTHWPGSLRERELCWIPASLGPIPLQEALDASETPSLLHEPSDLIGSTSADYVWKQPGVAILKDPEDDDLEQIEPLVEEEIRCTDLDSLIRKRRAELADANRPPPGSDIEHRNLLIKYDGSAVATLLSNHMEFCAVKRRKLSTSSFFTVQDNQAHEIPTKATVKHIAAQSQIKSSTPPPEAQLNKALPALCPPPTIPATHTKIIRSVTFSRSIFSRFTKLYPDVEVIERDFDRWNTVAWERSSVSRSPIVSPLAAEADIIVSPTTGVVVTTILRAIQKPPPGHKGSSEIRERLSSVALRYERLIVLVSEGNRIDEIARDLTPSECMAYADFTSFVAGLVTNGQVYYLGGGDDTMASWLLHFVAQYAPEAAPVQTQLIQDESHWELFLRRAGMNAYAAQAILSLLKRPGSEPDDNISRFGLPQFIRMSAAERAHRFAGLLGGENVLTRVSNVIDTAWNSAASD